jgi:hypothetical protein
MRTSVREFVRESWRVVEADVVVSLIGYAGCEIGRFRWARCGLMI